MSSSSDVCNLEIQDSGCDLTGFLCHRNSWAAVTGMVENFNENYAMQKDHEQFCLKLYARSSHTAAR